ncbi:hypothetical protein ACFX13_012956 [Malus domestica]
MEEVVKESSVVQKKLQRLSRNMSGAFALLKNLLNLDSASDSATALFGKIESSRKLVWGSVARSRDICASLWAYWTRRERRSIDEQGTSALTAALAQLNGFSSLPA